MRLGRKRERDSLLKIAVSFDKRCIEDALRAATLLFIHQSPVSNQIDDYKA